MSPMACHNITLRIVREIVKDRMRKQGLKLSHYPAQEIFNKAKKLYEEYPQMKGEERTQFQTEFQNYINQIRLP